MMSHQATTKGKDVEDYESLEPFERFQVNTTPQSYTCNMTAFFLLYFTFYWTLVFRESFNRSTVMISVLSVMLTSFPSLLLCYLNKYMKGKVDNRFLRLLESIVVLGFVITFSMIQVMRSFYGQCPALQQESLFFWHCLPALNAGSIITETSFFLLVLPLLFSIILPHVDMVIIHNAMAISSLTTLMSAISVEAVVSMTWIVSAIVFMWLLIFFYHSQRKELFLYMVRYQKELQAKECLQEKQRKQLADEMRNMIASVSHDLKSPLAAFISGIEMIRILLARLPNNENDGASDKLLADVNTVLNSVEGCYYLMLMTINRCTDYTKSMHKIPLVPNLEVVCVHDVIQRVVNTVSALQQNTSIHFKSTFNSVIVTDKQWLSDNLLCLVTNSIKYSSLEGECNILLKKVRLHELQKKREDEIFVNLSNNDSGDGKIRPNDEWLYLEVADKGNGVTKEEARKLFQSPDFSVQRSGGGSGLGLTCLARRLEVLQGYFGVSKRSDGLPGSVFWMCLPFQQSFNSQFTRRQSPDTKNHKKGDRSALNLQLPKTEVAESFDANSAFIETPSSSLIGTVNGEEDHTFRSKALSSLQSQSRDNPESCHEKLSICVVDDALPILKMLKLHLESHGHQITTASNGREALDILFDECDIDFRSSIGYRRARSNRPQQQLKERNSLEDDAAVTPSLKQNKFDVVLMDLQMPILDGIEAIRAIRNKEASSSENSSNDAVIGEGNELSCDPPHQLIIAMSANSDHITTQSAFDAGADGFIQKPFRLEKFYDAFRNYKSNHQEDWDNAPC